MLSVTVTGLGDFEKDRVVGVSLRVFPGKFYTGVSRLGNTQLSLSLPNDPTHLSFILLYSSCPYIRIQVLHPSDCGTCTQAS